MKRLLAWLFPCREVTYSGNTVSISPELAMRRLREAAAEHRVLWDKWEELSRRNGVTR